MTRLIYFIFFGLLITKIAAQKTNSPRDGIYTQNLQDEKKPLPYAWVHEKDIFWEKRVWSEIDLKQKKNQFFSHEKRSLFVILAAAAKAQKIELYHTIDDNFSRPLSLEEAYNTVGSFDTVQVCESDSVLYDFVVYNAVNNYDIVSYRLKEVYYLEEQTATMKVRILGIAPICSNYDDNGNFLHQRAMFWVYYPAVRAILAQEKAFNRFNDVALLSWEDVFEARLFSSYFIKENNNNNDRIKAAMKGGVNGLLVVEKIEASFFGKEQSIWSY